MTGPATHEDAGLIGTLPAGAFRPAGRGPFVMPCLDIESGSTCFRPQLHGGRHAFIALSGRVWRVWGDDVHKAKRERARLDEILATVLPGGGAS